MVQIVVSIVIGLAWFVGSAAPSEAGDVTVRTVEAIYSGQQELNGQRVQIRGKVVKVNSGIMGKNFIHIQDGTGTAGTNDLTVTMQQNVQVGDNIVVTGLVTVNRDFGAGYSYPVILEEAIVDETISP